VQLEFEHTVPIARAELFAFHADPANLAVLLADWKGFRLLRHERTIRVGAEVWFEQTVAGFIPIVIGVRHVLYEPPLRFAEELIHGPFDTFRHVHEFEEVPRGTRVRDVLEIRVRRLFGGELATRLLVAPRLRELFRVRHAALDRLSKGGPADARGSGA
jgi:ligand-binding SRPBCC domain-containing protein